jgi:hypothetical protein
MVMGQVLGGGEMSSGRSGNGFVFDFLFTFGRLVGDIGWFSVYEEGRRSEARQGNVQPFTSMLENFLSGSNRRRRRRCNGFVGCAN